MICSLHRQSVGHRQIFGRWVNTKFYWAFRRNKDRQKLLNFLLHPFKEQDRKEPFVSLPNTHELLYVKGKKYLQSVQANGLLTKLDKIIYLPIPLLGLWFQFLLDCLAVGGC